MQFTRLSKLQKDRMLPTTVKNQVRKKLILGLKPLRVSKGNLISAESIRLLLEQKFEIPVNTSKKLPSLIGDTSIADFFLARIADLSDQALKFDSEAPEVALSSLSKFEDTKQLADNLIEDLCTLPWMYVCYIPLPFLASCGFPHHIKLRKDLSLVVPNDDELADIRTPFSRRAKSLYEALNGRLVTRDCLDSKYFCLKVELSGLVTDHLSTPANERSLAIAKSFMGIGLVLGMFELSRHNRAFSPTALGDPLVFRKLGDGLYFIRELQLIREEADTFFRVEISPKLESPTLEEKQGNSYSIDTCLTLLIAALNSKDKSVQLASRWYFEGVCSTSRTLKIIQFATCLEVLLGDPKKRDGVTKNLEQSCRRLLGSTPEEQEVIAQWFLEAYDIRSRLLHSGEEMEGEELHRGVYIFQLLAGKVIAKKLALFLKGVQGRQVEMPT